MNISDFHAHLDKCEQCENHMFDLCPEGTILLMQAANHCTHGHCNHPPKCIGVGVPDERDPLGCCNCGTREEERKAKLPCSLCGRTRPPLPNEEVKTKGCTFGCGYPFPASDDARKKDVGG